MNGLKLGNLAILRSGRRGDMKSSVKMRGVVVAPNAYSCTRSVRTTYFGAGPPPTRGAVSNSPRARVKCAVSEWSK